MATVAVSRRKDVDASGGKGEQADSCLPEEKRSVASANAIGERGNAAEVLRLVREWMAEDSTYEDEVWPELRESLNRDHSSYRRLFP